MDLLGNLWVICSRLMGVSVYQKLKNSNSKKAFSALANEMNEVGWVGVHSLGVGW